MNKKDILMIDVPLFIRLLEYAREDAKTDMDLHNVTENIIKLSEEEKALTMNDYDKIVDVKETKKIEENFRMKQLAGLIVEGTDSKKEVKRIEKQIEILKKEIKDEKELKAELKKMKDGLVKNSELSKEEIEKIFN
jgi:hypothetical protein